MAEPIDFGVRIPDIFKAGFSGYLKNIVPLSLAGAVTLGIYGLFRYEAQQLLNADREFASLMVDLVGLIVSSTISYPWFSYSLSAARDEHIDMRDPFFTLNRFAHQAVASGFFWAGVLFGIRYGKALFFLPAIAVGLMYAFFGYVIADAPVKNRKGAQGGSFALGTSVRLGEKRRFGLFGIGCLLLMFNFFGAMFGLAIQDQRLLQYSVTILGLIITTSISMVAGAHIYDVLKEKLGD